MASLGPEVEVALDDIIVSEKTKKKVPARDRAQIDHIRVQFEQGLDIVPIRLLPAEGGGYLIEDGRHRYFAALLAGYTTINAHIIQ